MYPRARLNRLLAQKQTSTLLTPLLMNPEKILVKALQAAFMFGKLTLHS